MRFHTVIFAIAAIGLTTPGLARDSHRLEPSTPWQLDYAEDSCRLGRFFGEGDDRTVLLFDRFRPSDMAYITLAGRPARFVSTARGRTVDVHIRFGADGVVQDKQITTGNMGDLRPALIFGPVSPDPQPPKDRGDHRETDLDAHPESQEDRAAVSAERLAAITSVTFGARGHDRLTLDTGPLAKPFAALRRCMDELVTHWGLDPEKLRAQQRPPIPLESPTRWITASDYPRGAALMGVQGMVDVRMMVNAQGQPTSCHIQSGTEPEFEKVACAQLMEKGHFHPAVDAAGAPTASVYINRVLFRAG